MQYSIVLFVIVGIPYLAVQVLGFHLRRPLAYALLRMIGGKEVADGAAWKDPRIPKAPKPVGPARPLESQL